MDYTASPPLCSTEPGNLALLTPGLFVVPSTVYVVLTLRRSWVAAPSWAVGDI